MDAVLNVDLMRGGEWEIEATDDIVQRYLYSQWLVEDVNESILIARTPHSDEISLETRYMVCHNLRQALELGYTSQETFENSFAGWLVRRGLVLGGVLSCQQIGLWACDQQQFSLQEVISIQDSLPPLSQNEDPLPEQF